MSRASLIRTTSHRRLLAARQALENMLPGAKSWPQLLVRPLDSGSLLACKVYLTDCLALALANPRTVAFLLGPAGKATSGSTPCLAFLAYRPRRPAGPLNMRSHSWLNRRCKIESSGEC